MRTIAPITGIVVANSGVTLLARIYGQAGTLITQATISTIQYSVRDLSEAVTTTALTTLGSPSSLIYNDLQQNDPRWNLDSADNPHPDDGRWGYNFLATLGASLFTDFDVQDEAPFTVVPHRWAVSVVLTPVSGAKFHIPYAFTAHPTWE